MNLAIETLAYKEERLIPKFIQHYQDKVDKIAVLNSKKPWNGESEEEDNTAKIARSLGADIYEYHWTDETSQRNDGLVILNDYDWAIILDPDEYVDNQNWEKLTKFLETAPLNAYVAEHQRVFWKHSEVYPHTDYQQIIAVRPKLARFNDNRCIDCAWGIAPVELLHFSWAKTDEEILSKITHYAHANDLIPDWYENVWLADKKTNLHPHTPETLKALIPAVLPPEIEELNLWPQ